MYRTACQRGMLTIFFGSGSAPLKSWDVCTRDGCVSRFVDPDINAMVLEIIGTNVSTCHMTCPKGKQNLGIAMPFLVMIVKNLKKYFTFEVTILDETNTRRRFRVSNFQSTTTIMPLCTAMPIGLSDGWNQIQFNLAEFTRRAYKKQYLECLKVRINANIRIRRIYFAERLYSEEELPPCYKLFFPLGKNKKPIPPSEKEELKKEEPPLEPVPPEEESEAKRTSLSQTAIEAPETEALKVEICICPDDTGEIGTNEEMLTAPDCSCVGPDVPMQRSVSEARVASVVAASPPNVESLDRSAPAEAVEPENAEVEPGTAEVEPETAQVEAEPVEVEAEPVEVEAEPVEAEPDTVEVDEVDTEPAEPTTDEE